MSDLFLARIRELKFKQLLVFERVVELGSMHKAAEVLHMSQPNVFKIITQLEELLDVPLFERSSRGVVPTVSALRLLPRIKPMLGDARAMSEELAALRNGERGQIAIGTLISASARLLPHSIALMKQRHPHVNIVVQEATNDLLFPMLAVGELDLILGRVPESRPAGLSYHALYQEQLVLVARAGHPLHAQKSYLAQDLLAYPWILPTHASSVRTRVEQFFARQQLPLPANLVESLSMLTNLGLLRASDTLAMLPRTAAQPLIDDGTLCQLPTGEDLVFGTIGYAMREQRMPTPACATFLSMLHEVATALAPAGNSKTGSPPPVY